MGRGISLSEESLIGVAPLATRWGVFTGWFASLGLRRLFFPGGAPRCPPAAVILPAGAPEVRRVCQALDTLLAGAVPRRLPPLDLAGATPFQREVWRALQAIPSGQTRSYAEIAAAVGRPRAARAVGQACGANPVPVLIPCHRVRAADGGLGGFSAGLGWKCQLLEAEGGRA